ncbi:PDC sensor domain-containing protein [Caballeronia grimmiae]|uniref:PDC sensor domain-containing protein n=1 Tax=Caballeronia grimmiae TaxID=1071679 RepID=UPI0038BC4C6A
MNMTVLPGWHKAQRTRAQRKSCALAFALLIGLWTALVAYIAWDRQAELSIAMPQARALADVLAGSTNRSLRAADEIAATISWHVQREGPDIPLRTYVASGLVRLDDLVQIAVIDKDGILRASTVEGFRPIDLSDRDHFRVHVHNRSSRLHIGQSVVGRVSGKPSIQLSRRIEDAQGHFIGVVVVSMAPSYLTDLYDALRIGEHGVVEIVNSANLFEQKRFSLRNGETLLALIRTLGISKVTQNARKLAEQPGRRSSEEILNYLAGGPADADCKVKVQLAGDKVTFSFSYKARATRRDLVDVDQLQSIASFALGNLVELSRR